MHGPVAIGDLAPWIGAKMGFDLVPHAAGMQSEDRREVVAGRLGESQTVLFGAWLGALVGPDHARSVRADADPGEKTVARQRLAPRSGELLVQRPDRRLAVGDEHALKGPRLEGLVGVVIGIATGRRLRKVDLDHVERGAREELGALGGVDHVVGGSGDVGERGDRRKVVVKGLEWPDLRHRGATLPGSGAAPWRRRTAPGFPAAVSAGS